jgi:glutamate racemase
LEAGADTVVLGCTHYPFLSDSIKQLSQGCLQIVETSIPVTHQLIRVLQQAERKCQQAIEGKVTFYTSKADAQHFHSMQFLWQQPLMPLVLPPSYL